MEAVQESPIVCMWYFTIDGKEGGGSYRGMCTLGLKQPPPPPPTSPAQPDAPICRLLDRAKKKKKKSQFYFTK